MSAKEPDLLVQDLEEAKHHDKQIETIQTEPAAHNPSHAEKKEDDKIELPPEDEPTEIKNCNIFISYQWKSQTQIRKLHDQLANHESLNTFMDIYKIKAGMNLYLTLATNLQQADIVLACVTRDYVKSKNCEREIIYADAFSKPIIPLFIEKIPTSELGSIGFLLIRERFCSMYK